MNLKYISIPDIQDNTTSPTNTTSTVSDIGKAKPVVVPSLEFPNDAINDATFTGFEDGCWEGLLEGLRFG